MELLVRGVYSQLLSTPYGRYQMHLAIVRRLKPKTLYVAGELGKFAVLRHHTLW